MSFEVIKSKAKIIKNNKENCPKPIYNSAIVILDETKSKKLRIVEAYDYLQNYEYNEEDKDDPLNKDDYLKVFYNMIHKMY